MKKKHLLLLIVIVTIFLRFFQLGQNPPSLTWDEVAWGYNAYAIGTDGKDEFGKLLPIQYIESFGDFKPPVYAYLDVIPVKLFGLNEFAVRFPSALFGVLTVFITYFLVKRIFPKRWGMPVIATALLAISPWHINLSRAAFEANIATFFIIMGVWLFLCGIAEKKWYIILASISFVLSMYTFNTARIVTPLLVLGLTLGFRRQLLHEKRYVFQAFIIGIILVVPLAQFLFSPQAKLRFQEVNIFSNVGTIERINQEVANDGNPWWSKVIHNRRLTFGVEYLAHYFDHFNPNFLFIKGDGNPKFSTQDVGELYLWELPFLLVGTLLLFRKREDNWWLIPLWLLVGIIPAATARETPHALRIETTLPTWQIIVAYGFMQALLWFKSMTLSTSLRKLFLTGFFLIPVASFLYYYHGYYAHYPYEYSGEWQYGYKDAISYVKEVEKGYGKVVFTEALGRPYVYMLFYRKENPTFFRQNATVFRESYGFVHVKSYGKYIFSEDPNSIVTDTKGKALYVDKSKNVPATASILKIFYLLNGEPILTAYTL